MIEYNEYYEIETLSIVLSTIQRRFEFLYEIFLLFFSKYIVLVVEFVERANCKHWGDIFCAVVNVIINICPRCQTCKEILVGSQIQIGPKEKRITFNNKTRMNCGVRDFLYVLTCNACKENYIGESGDALRDRAAVHRNQIAQAQYRKLNVSNHIYNCAKDVSPMFTICPFYKLHNQDDIFRKEKEEYFIQKFKPSLNRAQNN